MDTNLTLWQNVQAELKTLSTELGTDLTKVEVALKNLFNMHVAVASVSDTTKPPAVVAAVAAAAAAAPTPDAAPAAAVAAVLNTTPTV